MRALIQRVSSAKVEVDNEIKGSINKGLLVLFGVHEEDTSEPISYLCEKLIHLRIFPDDNNKMNRSLVDVKGDLLIVSQFTLYADCSQGRRPSYIHSAKAEKALKLYEAFLSELKKISRQYGTKIETGVFGADMRVSLVNDGPVTIILEK